MEATCQDHDTVLATKFCACAGTLGNFCEPCFTLHCEKWHTLVSHAVNTPEVTNCKVCTRGPAITFCICTSDFPPVCANCQTQHCSSQPFVHWMFPSGLRKRIGTNEAKEFVRNKVYFYLSGVGKMQYSVEKLFQCRGEIMKSLATLGNSQQVKEAEEKELRLLTEVESRLTSEIEYAKQEVQIHLLDKTFTSQSGVSEALFKFNTLEDMDSLDFFNFECTRAGLDCDPMSGVVWECRVLENRQLSTAWMKLKTKQIVTFRTNGAIHYTPATNKTNVVGLRENIRNPAYASWTFLPCGGVLIFGFYSGSNGTNDSIIIRQNGETCRTGNLVSLRFGSGACYFNNWAYCFGGYHTSNLSTCEKFNLARQEWEGMQKMQSARHYFNPVIFRDLIYICGGNTTECEVFNPQNETFAALGFSLPESSQCATILYEKSLLIFTSTVLTFYCLATKKTKQRQSPAGSIGSRHIPIVIGEHAYLTSNYGADPGLRKLNLSTYVLTDLSF